METSQVQTIEDARQIVEQRELDYIKVGLFDVDGVMRGKYMHRDKFLSALEGGFGFCDVSSAGIPTINFMTMSALPAGTPGMVMRRFR